MFSRLLYGAQLTVGVALAATVAGFVLGMAVGFSAAEIGGRFDDVVTWDYGPAPEPEVVEPEEAPAPVVVAAPETSEE